MKLEEAIKGNQLIADFVGVNCQNLERYWSDDWGLLLDAYFEFQQKIRDFLKREPMQISFCGSFISGILNEDINGSFNALVDGIKWYNHNALGDYINKY